VGLTRRLLRRIGHRRVLVMADQATSSLSNVLVTVVVARALDDDAFGAFSAALVAYQLATGAVRAAVGEPFLSAHAGETGEERRRAAADLVPGAFVASVACSVVMALAALALADAVAGPLVALALTFPFLGIQDSLRHVAVVDRPDLALASDLAWLVAVVALLAVAPGGASPSWYVVAWGVAGVVGLAVALATLRVPLGWGSATRWLGEHRRMAGAFLAETATARAVGQVVVLALGAIAGLGALGAVRAAQVFYGPLNTLFSGIYLALVPDGARRRDDPAGLLRFMLVASAVVTSAAAAWTVVGVALPDGWGESLFGDTWAEAEDVMLPSGLAVVAGSAATGAFAGLRSLGAAGASLRARLASLPPEALCALGGAAAGGAVGYSVGFAVGNTVMAAIFWAYFLAALRAPREPAPPGESGVSGVAVGVSQVTAVTEREGGRGV
jgi:O-antigen/teichoic acid export membrane protein